MSWRTQGEYRGLDETAQEWISGFDRSWDGKSEGRSRTDALDRLGGNVDKAASQRPDYYRLDTAGFEKTDGGILEAELLTIASKVARFTVPKRRTSGWSIHLVMKCGRRIRAHFDDWDSAVQAYQALEELSLWFLAG